MVHRDPTVWVTSPHHLIHERDPLPIAVYHDGCIFRKWTIEALEKEHKAYRIVYVSTSVSGIIAAVESGLAVAPLGLSYLPKHLKALGPESGFPCCPPSGSSFTCLPRPMAIRPFISRGTLLVLSGNIKPFDGS